MTGKRKTAGAKSGCNCILTLTTRQYELDGVGLFTDDCGDYDGEPLDAPGDDSDSGVIEMVTEAAVAVKGGRLTVSYDETEITGLGESRTEISFALDDPTVISVMRTGEVRTALVIEQGVRHICTYETPVMPFEICTYARKATNSVTVDGGEMHLDYIVEIRGALAQRTVLDVTLRKADAASYNGENI